MIIPHDAHTISRKNISQNALKVLYKLHDTGYQAYLVGGSVRDLLLGGRPKDFDVATDAHPENVKKLFRNCLLIGRRFRLAHIRFGDEVIEVATFRAKQTAKKHLKHHTSPEGIILRDNVYGTIHEDAERRDFTINALYYNIADFSVVDYWGGFEDLKHKQLRIIGDPKTRYQEDPVRLLRAIRFAGKLGFEIELSTAELIQSLASSLQHIPPARLFDEILKIFLSKHSAHIIPLLRKYHLFSQLFPELDPCLENPATEKILKRLCENTDKRLMEKKSVSPTFIYAVLLWHPYQYHLKDLLAQHYHPMEAKRLAMRAVLSNQSKRSNFTKKISMAVKEIWILQDRLERPKANRTRSTLSHPRFRAGYDFLLLREEAGESCLHNAANFWKSGQTPPSRGRGHTPIT